MLRQVARCLKLCFARVRDCVTKDTISFKNVSVSVAFIRIRVFGLLFEPERASFQNCTVCAP